MLHSRHFTIGARACFIACFIFALYTLIAWRLYTYTVLKKDHYTSFIEHTHKTSRARGARRGLILDRRMVVLAMTQQLIDVGVDPFAVCPEKDQDRWPQLAELLGLTLDELKKAMTRHYVLRDGKKTKICWKKLGTLTEERAYEALLNLHIKGVYGSRRSERIYPSGHIASHVIGFVNREDVAVSGVERHMDFFLKGHEGCLTSECDGRRSELVQFRELDIPAQNGANVTLTLDMSLQNAVEDLLDRWDQRYHPRWMSVLVSDALTGELLALGNRPSFDLNAYAQAELDDLRNRAVTDTYEPGSVFKIVPVSLGIEWKAVDLQQIFDCSQGKVEYDGKHYLLPKDHRLMERLTVAEILSRSSNRGVAQIALRLGARKLYRGIKLFGFGEKPGYGFDGEQGGVLHPPFRWDRLTITRLPMGHAISVTPLQIHQAMGVLASGGFLLRPQIVAFVQGTKGEELLRNLPEIRRRILSPSTVSSVAHVLHDEDKMCLLGVKCAGKSGTSQKIIDGRYSSEHHVSSFSGFFPIENPQVVITVVVDDAQVESGIAWGSRVAFPFFKKLAKKIIRYYEIAPSVEESDDTNILASLI
ncbi:MAG: penicillin-binding protein 2 [Puniceicoccales bacterium]|jgi:cell division protein FtsI (penicillin-binding protein 3)/stage V sporulation protein D (sporulation-specific penicillin-binding protein)|nr:penicillin-binding protein 2 [Puniceicoccales bacterium]